MKNYSNLIWSFSCSLASVYIVESPFLLLIPLLPRLYSTLVKQIISVNVGGWWDVEVCRYPWWFVHTAITIGTIQGYWKWADQSFLPILWQEVEPMYVECDHLHITALTSALGVPVRVQYMDRAEGGHVNQHDFPEGAPPRIHLLYRPGHYDILYQWWSGGMLVLCVLLI